MNYTRQLYVLNARKMLSSVKEWNRVIIGNISYQTNPVLKVNIDVLFKLQCLFALGYKINYSIRNKLLLSHVANRAADSLSFKTKRSNIVYIQRVFCVYSWLSIFYIAIFPDTCIIWPMMDEPLPRILNDPVL